jgi:Inhibitor of Apoptosis domain
MALIQSTVKVQASMGCGRGYQSLYFEERRDLDKLNVRKETFVFYPPSPVRTLDIAAAGFHYTGEDYTVRCFVCKVTVPRFADSDDPFSVHQRLSPNCPFVFRTVTNNHCTYQRRRPSPLPALCGRWSSTRTWWVDWTAMSKSTIARRRITPATRTVTTTIAT